MNAFFLLLQSGISPLLFSFFMYLPTYVRTNILFFSARISIDRSEIASKRQTYTHTHTRFGFVVSHAGGQIDGQVCHTHTLMQQVQYEIVCVCMCLLFIVQMLKNVILLLLLFHFTNSRHAFIHDSQ